jgi:hypothetical protein
MPTFARTLILSLLLVVVIAATIAARQSTATTPDELMVGVPDQTVLMVGESLPEGVVPLALHDDGYLSPVSAAPRPFTNLLLRWEARQPVGAGIAFELRASLDGTEWSEWGPVRENPELWEPDDGAEVFWSEELYAGEGMQFWQLRVRLSPDPAGQLPELRRVELNSVDARFGPRAPAAVLDQPTIGLASIGRPPVVSRSGWGSPDGQGSRATPAYRSVSHLIVHHTAEANSLRPGQSWADRVRAIWSFHAITRGWGDIGYNYLIDPNGVIYEGRAGGDNAVGFHDTANYGSMGVALIGTYSSIDPPPAAFESLVNLLAWKAAQQEINPLERSYYRGCAISNFCTSYSPDAIIANIAGHRDVTPVRTTCPGDRFASRLPELRQRVAGRISGTPSPPPQASLELTNVRYERQSLAAGELLKVIFTVRNSGSTAILGQAPEAATLGMIGPELAIEESHVYDEGECFLGDPAQSYLSFPKEVERFRVMLGSSDAVRQPACAGETGGYPWRWGINGSLAPGASRELVGYVRLRTPGTLTLRAGAIHEYVDYMAQDVGAVTVAVSGERHPPLPVVVDEQLRPLAHVYRLSPMPYSLIARSPDPNVAVRGAYLGSFAWDGELRHWGLGGPLPGVSDYFLIEQTRSFEAPVAGTYTFRTSSDDGSWLWVNGRLVISQPGQRNAGPTTGTIELAAGRHVLSFKMFELSGDAVAGYSVRPPGYSDFISPHDGFVMGAGDRIGSRFRALEALTLVADDLGGSGITQLRVALNDGPWQNFSGPIATISGFNPGSNSLRYTALDQAGNESTLHNLNFVIEPDLVVHRTYLPLVR